MNVPVEFVNREEELEKVYIAFDALQDRERLLRNPIIEFYGVQGIGKSALLQKIKSLCEDRSIFCIINKADKFNPLSLIKVKKMLSNREPAVIMFDDLDAANSEQLQTVEASLGEIIEYDKLFVVLASKNRQTFDTTRTLTRRLTTYHLRSLEPVSCVKYIKTCGADFPEETRNRIYEWTKGYPLAMRSMIDIIANEQLDPVQDQKKILTYIMEEVLEKNLFVKIASEDEKVRLRILLALLSIPRRFNLILIQKVVEEFAPKYKRENSLAYITFPSSINEATGVLNWSLERAGYAIEAPLRNLFLLQYRIEQPEHYAKIHKFLAAENKTFIAAVNGSDSIRYLREFFYHLAFSEDEAYVRTILENYIEKFVQEVSSNESSSLSAFDDFLQFYEEFQSDTELQEALKAENTSFVLSRVRKVFVEVYRQFSLETRGQYLRRFFSYTTLVAKDKDFFLIFEDSMRQIIEQENPEDAKKLYEELFQDEGFQNLLGKDFDMVKMRISSLLEDGA